MEVIMKDWRAILAEGRNKITEAMAGTNWTYTYREEKFKEYQKQLDKIDQLLLAIPNQEN